MISIDETIEHAKESARENRYRSAHRSFHNNDKDEINACIRCAEEHEQLAEWLEKLKYIENIILKWNADIYNDEDTGIPDDEILEAIFNACTDNGFDIQIDEEYREGYAKGYNKAIDDFAKRIEEYLGVENATKYGNKDADQQENSYSTIMKYEIAYAIEDIAEQLKKGGADAGSI